MMLVFFHFEISHIPHVDTDADKILKGNHIWEICKSTNFRKIHPKVMYLFKVPADSIISHI
jgi:hypothetical protein